ncbi:hypothetical protein L0664_08790 [Octadecabacter sp. G9-8]|uniref:Argininosuccinate lyase n=1 Tax=Octadecabacter dasysiphoniae TaxID=2909341 RepID=A0ABS9CV68_9RHOB|nr:hypothetical protein [Octadecabacter dasysiphoniae]MCF2871161.1 hypothetical protein [Octadecabacter dasysiphoniae]
MTIKIFALTALAFVAACGANDPPFRPTGNVGVSAGTNGVNTSANVGATNGTFSVGLSL